ncbi:hypothetical protein TNCV_4867431 [Trichonephila clavipes]|nr:hypothetical protein TNCV_4867431 [Trichonephila clavipes]
MVLTSQRSVEGTPVLTSAHSFFPSHMWPWYTCMERSCGFGKEEIKGVYFLCRSDRSVKSPSILLMRCDGIEDLNPDRLLSMKWQFGPR